MPIKKKPAVKWRRGWDSNPRYGFPYARFRGEYFQPLSHLSAANASLIVARVWFSSNVPWPRTSSEVICILSRSIENEKPTRPEFSFENAATAESGNRLHRVQRRAAKKV